MSISEQFPFMLVTYNKAKHKVQTQQHRKENRKQFENYAGKNIELVELARL